MTSVRTMRLRVAAATLWLSLAGGAAPAATLQQDAVCDTPPCTREELQRYELKLIRRLQQANRLSFEARNRGDEELADRLHRVFRRSFDRRTALLQVMASSPE